MNNVQRCEKRGDLINSVIDSYGEWIEMSQEPDHTLIEILANLLMASQEENEYLKKRICSGVKR